jgi:hypothetical protein
MTKSDEPIEFLRDGPNRFTCPAGSQPGQRYVLSVERGTVFCTCEGSVRRGPDTCKHARALRAWLNESGVADLLDQHRVTIRDDVPGMNFLVLCVCGWSTAVTSVRREFAEQVAAQHGAPASQPLYGAPLPDVDLGDDFARTHARADDPDTSYEAAQTAEQRVSDRVRFLGWFLRVNDRAGGWTWGEVDAGLREMGLEWEEDVHKRLPDAERAGLAVTSAKRVCTVRGTVCQTWYAA